MSCGLAVSSTPSPSGSPLRRLRLFPTGRHGCRDGQTKWRHNAHRTCSRSTSGTDGRNLVRHWDPFGEAAAVISQSLDACRTLVSRLWLGSDAISSVHEVSSCPSTSSRVGMVHWRCRCRRRCWTGSAHGWIGRDTRIGCVTAVECRSCLHSPPRLVCLQREFRPTYRAWYDRNYGRSADIELAKRSPFRGVLVGLCDLGSVSCLGHRQQLDP